MNNISDAPKIKVISFCSEDTGGAGIAALRQHEALIQGGIFSRHYVVKQTACRESVNILPLNNHRKALFCRQSPPLELETYSLYWKRINLKLKQYNCVKEKEIFTIPGSCFEPSDDSLLHDFTIVNLHWVCGMCDPALSSNFFDSYPVVWTLHDMNPFTGGCHHSDDCIKFTRSCGACPNLNSEDEQDLSYQNWLLRMSAYQGMNLNIVCPSRWLAEQVRSSSLMGRFPVHVIPNCIPVDIFRPLPLPERRALRAKLGIAPEFCVLSLSSRSLGNIRKGGQYLLEALLKLETSNPAKQILVLLVGENAVPAGFNHIRVLNTGYIHDPHTMSLLYNISDAIVVPSIAENLPNVISEALSCGTPVIASNIGGIPEMIIHKKTGFLFSPKNVDELTQGILWADSVRDDMLRTRRLCRIQSLENWSPASISEKYIKLYTELLQ